MDNCEKEIIILKQKLIRIEEHVEQNKALLENIYMKLFGNGQEGIITTMTKHKVYFLLIGSAISIMAIIVGDVLVS